MIPWIRPIHRWASVGFTLGVVANLVAGAMGSEAVWVGLIALAPLLVLLGTGLVLFALPYTTRRRGMA